MTVLELKQCVDLLISNYFDKREIFKLFFKQNCEKNICCEDLQLFSVLGRVQVSLNKTFKKTSPWTLGICDVYFSLISDIIMTKCAAPNLY